MADKDFFFGVLHISGPGGGWSEKYPMNAGLSQRADAVNNFAELATHRATCLADGFSIVWARVSPADSDRQSFAVINQPLKPGLQPRPDPAPADANMTSNSVEAALHFRLETPEGRWANRLFRGIRDDVIADNSLGEWVGFTPLGVNDAYLPLTAMIGDPAVNTFSTIAPWKNLLKAIRTHTKIAHPVYEVVNRKRTLVGWDLFNIASVQLRGVAAKKTGRPFGQSPGRAKKRLGV